MLELIRPGIQIDFMGKRRLWMGLSVAAILLTIGSLFTKGLNYGIDFTGGAEVQVHVPELGISENSEISRKWRL